MFNEAMETLKKLDIFMSDKSSHTIIVAFYANTCSECDAILVVNRTLLNKFLIKSEYQAFRLHKYAIILSQNDMCCV